MLSELRTWRWMLPLVATIWSYLNIERQWQKTIPTTDKNNSKKRRTKCLTTDQRWFGFSSFRDYISYFIAFHCVKIQNIIEYTYFYIFSFYFFTFQTSVKPFAWNSWIFYWTVCFPFSKQTQIICVFICFATKSRPHII